MNDKSTLITIRVSEEVKDNLKAHLGSATFKELIYFAEALFEEGDIYSEDGHIYLNQSAEPTTEKTDNPLMAEFKAACDSRSMDFEFGLRKAINAIKRRDI